MTVRWDSAETVSEQGREKALKSLKDIMRPEFINRVDEVISFNQLTEEDFAKICIIMLGELKRAMAHSGVTMTYDQVVGGLAGTRILFGQIRARAIFAGKLRKK